MSSNNNLHILRKTNTQKDPHKKIFYIIETIRKRRK